MTASTLSASQQVSNCWADASSLQKRSIEKVEAVPVAHTTQAGAIEAVEAMLADLSTIDAPMPERHRVVAVLGAILAVLKQPPPAKEPSRDVLRALAAMVADPRIVSTGDLGRALDPSLKTKAERACALGGNRMRQMLARGWVTRERFARWSLTEAGRAEHEHHTRGIKDPGPVS